MSLWNGILVEHNGFQLWQSTPDLLDFLKQIYYLLFISCRGVFPLQYCQNCNGLTVTRNLLFPSILKYSPLNSQPTGSTRRRGREKNETLHSLLYPFSVRRFKKRINQKWLLSILSHHAPKSTARNSLGQARSCPWLLWLPIKSKIYQNPQQKLLNC